MIRCEKPLSEVFPTFLGWLITTTSGVSHATGILHYPGLIIQSYSTDYMNNFTVLVAHNGFAFDFPILLAEVERRPMELSIKSFEANRIHFCDTLPCLRKVVG